MDATIKEVLKYLKDKMNKRFEDKSGMMEISKAYLEGYNEALDFMISDTSGAPLDQLNRSLCSRSAHIIEDQCNNMLNDDPEFYKAQGQVDAYFQVRSFIDPELMRLDTIMTIEEL